MPSFLSNTVRRGRMCTRQLGVLAVPVVALVALVVLPSAAGGSSPPRLTGQIVFGSEHAGEDEIWVMNADGSNKRDLTRHDGAKISDLDPRWSPDGRQIAFSSDPGGNRQIWVMNADGSRAHQVTNAPGANRDPSWTADGRSIVFQSNNGGSFEIYRVNADGTGLSDLTNDPAADWSPAASPVGDRIVFTSERDGTGHLYVLDGRGRLTRITDGPGYDYFAAWSPLGNRIVFSHDDTAGQTDLYMINADGSGERRLTNTPGVYEYFPVFSPDGGKVAYTACTANPPGILPDENCRTHVLDLAGGGDVDLGFPGLAVQFPLTDDFNSNARNVDLWSVIHDGTGGTYRWGNGELELSIAADGAPTDGSPIGLHVAVNCVLSGDFDVRADYRLLDWPVGDGVNAGINAFFTNGSINRTTDSGGETYNAFLDPAFASVPTSDRSGTLRLVRSGSTMTSYYRSGTTWVQLASAPAQVTPAIVALQFKSFGNFGHQAARVAFDNFRLDATNADCSSIRPDYHPDWWSAVRR